MATRDPESAGSSGRDERDPTKMANQAALQTSSGLVWVVVGTLFAVVSLVPLAALIFVSPGPSLPVAIATGILIIVLYALMLGARLRIPRGPRRLRFMAVYMLSMAGIALLGVLICALVEGAAAQGPA